MIDRRESEAPDDGRRGPCTAVTRSGESEAPTITDARVIGALLLVLGGLALWEGWRLRALRTQMLAGAVVGDDTFPTIIGLAFLALGGCALVAKLPAARAAFPGGDVRARMVVSAGVLVAYVVLLPLLGYTASTAFAAAALFRTMGGYRSIVCLLLAGIVTTALYLLFRVWLLQPLPAGWLGR
jgi:tripartite tricarboxylate transporter TctB family protein